uniref:Transmembrane protein n=1 Tax=Chromera velia CCMP2878 TaxID=1169474 RepID=A0A0G4FCX5_9ALVE|eukprot:Cvel_16259.t1-p1 / transcript=Cvel_16259.t1 / gene=Cvel_16259 / organism=Chromera_velia_CCMP2878 / gene_product=hypothetical protein / transcript_product=hypothetical protein / location=Cvel_scaffold1244:36061-40626(-) / protein_length=1012 / sequence_SO=supercontig / SO=protein_coding / is_pseudo=false
MSGEVLGGTEVVGDLPQQSLRQRNTKKLIEPDTDAHPVVNLAAEQPEPLARSFRDVILSVAQVSCAYLCVYGFVTLFLEFLGKNLGLSAFLLWTHPDSLHLQKAYAISSLILLIMAGMDLFPLIFGDLSVQAATRSRKTNPSLFHLVNYSKDCTAGLFVMKTFAAVTNGILCTNLLPVQIDAASVSPSELQELRSVDVQHLLRRFVSPVRTAEWVVSGVASMFLLGRLLSARGGSKLFLRQKRTSRMLGAGVLAITLAPVLLHLSALFSSTVHRAVLGALHMVLVILLFFAISTLDGHYRSQCRQLAFSGNLDVKTGSSVLKLSRLQLAFFWLAPVACLLRGLVVLGAHVLTDGASENSEVMERGAFAAVVVEQAVLSILDVALRGAQSFLLTAFRNDLQDAIHQCAFSADQAARRPGGSAFPSLDIAGAGGARATTVHHPVSRDRLWGSQGIVLGSGMVLDGDRSTTDRSSEDIGRRAATFHGVGTSISPPRGGVQQDVAVGGLERAGMNLHDQSAAGRLPSRPSSHEGEDESAYADIPMMVTPDSKMRREMLEVHRRNILLKREKQRRESLSQSSQSSSRNTPAVPSAEEERKEDKPSASAQKEDSTVPSPDLPPTSTVAPLPSPPPAQQSEVTRPSSHFTAPPILIKLPGGATSGPPSNASHRNRIAAKQQTTLGGRVSSTPNNSAAVLPPIPEEHMVSSTPPSPSAADSEDCIVRRFKSPPFLFPGVLTIDETGEGGRLPMDVQPPLFVAGGVEVRLSPALGMNRAQGGNGRLPHAKRLIEKVQAHAQTSVEGGQQEGTGGDRKRGATVPPRGPSLLSLGGCPEPPSAEGSAGAGKTGQSGADSFLFQRALTVKIAKAAACSEECPPLASNNLCHPSSSKEQQGKGVSRLQPPPFSYEKKAEEKEKEPWGVAFAVCQMKAASMIKRRCAEMERDLEDEEDGEMEEKQAGSGSVEERKPLSAPSCPPLTMARFGGRRMVPSDVFAFAAFLQGDRFPSLPLGVPEVPTAG